MEKSVKSVFGVVTDDPAAKSPIGTTMEFRPEAFPLGSPPGEYTLIYWDHFGGVLLKVVIADSDKVHVLGSAVLVAPGVALAARHVLEPHLKELQAGVKTVTCASISSSQLMLWHCSKLTMVGEDSDMAVLILQYCSAMPPGNVFRIAVITTRLPEVGEPVTMAGFTASDPVFPRKPTSVSVSGHVRASVGAIAAWYPSGRDRVMMPGPALQIASSASGGMSGGPVFDQHGHLLGLVSTSLGADDHVGPAFVSLIWPALITPIEPIWPNGLHTAGRPLFEFGVLCCIDKADAIQRIGQNEFSYEFWS